MTERIIVVRCISNTLSSLRRSTVRSVSYVGASQLIVLFLNLLTVTVIARFLTPEDFGIVAIGMAFVALFISIQDFGIAPAVIQRDTRIEECISAGSALRWIIAVVLLLLVVVISPFVANFYGNPDLALVLVLLSLNLIIQPIAFSSFVLLNRSLSFFRLAVAVTTQSLVMSVVSIGLVFVDFSYWSLVFGSLCGSVAYVAVLIYYERGFCWPKTDRLLMKELMSFGQHLLIVALMSFVIYSVDQLVVGKVLGVAIAGIYLLAARFGRTLGEQISSTANRVLFPTMARLKDSIGQLRTGYIQSLRMISIVAAPISMVISSLSGLLVTVVLGDKWAAATVPLSILAFQGLFNSLVAPAANVLISIGKPRYMSIQATAMAVAMVVGVYPAALFFGLDGVCALSAALSLGVLIYFMLLFHRILGTSLKEILSPLAPSLVSGLVTYAILAVSAAYVPRELEYLVGLVLLGTGVYIVALHILSGGRDLRESIALIGDSFGKRA